MARDYTITQFKVGTYQDQNGNTWCDMVLAEQPSEPVRIVVKDPSKFSDGMKLYGEIKNMTAQSGKPYQRFFREQKPEQTASSSQGSSYDNNGAKFGNALKISADFYLTRGVAEMNEDDFVEAVESLAKRIFNIQIPGTAVGSTETVKQTQGSTSSEIQSLASTAPDVVADVPDEEIDLSSIPFN